MHGVLPGRPASSTPRSLTRSECLAFLRGHNVGRAAYTQDGMLTIVPTPFDLDHGRITFGEGRPRLLDRAAGQVVTLQCDGLDDLAGEAWSLCATGFVVRGTAGELYLEPRLFTGWAEPRTATAGT